MINRKKEMYKIVYNLKSKGLNLNLSFLYE